MARRTVLIGIRETLGITQAVAAKRVGLTENYLRSIETGVVPLSDSALVKIARGYGVSLDQLIADLNPSKRRARGVAA